MRLFGRSDKTSKRFPVERLSYLPMAIGSAIETCALNHNLDSKSVWKSKFVGGYLLGYTTYLDTVDARLGSAIRQLLFDSLLGPENGRALFKVATGHFLLDDPQTKRGYGAALIDGERYFKSLESKQDATDFAESLKIMFTIGSVDIDQAAI